MQKNKTIPTASPTGAELKRKHTLIVEVTFANSKTAKDAKRAVDEMLNNGASNLWDKLPKLAVKDAERYINGKANPLRVKLNQLKEIMSYCGDTLTRYSKEV